VPAISSQLRLRVFAGPNGSGKSTIIKSVQSFTTAGRPIDFCTYINADDIARDLRGNRFSFAKYAIQTSKDAFLQFAQTSGLLSDDYSLDQLVASFTLRRGKVHVSDASTVERLAQLIARFLREELLRLDRRFSFETVFSHKSNLDIMRQAAAKGYKVYLYFVSTESPEINKYRVRLRVAQNGHDVPEAKIESRYYRSLALMMEAAHICYQAFFFDNSTDDAPFTLVAHMKRKGAEVIWDYPEPTRPKWFEMHWPKNGME
jgi:predicted ABC-type ATPase